MEFPLSDYLVPILVIVLCLLVIALLTSQKFRAAAKAALPRKRKTSFKGKPQSPPDKLKNEKEKKTESSKKERSKIMSIQLGDAAPNFKAETTEGEIDFYDWKGDSWVVLFSHPKDFTPVCTTELGYTAKLKGEFDKRNAKAIGLSCDSVEDHESWSRDIAETQGYAPNFPMIGDADASVANLYGMIHPNADDTMTVRSVFVIDPSNKIRLTITYPASTGRNFDEVLRVIDSLQLTDKYKVATPVNWKEGEDVIIVPAVSDEDAEKLFPDGWDTQKPYLRVVPQPKN